MDIFTAFIAIVDRLIQLVSARARSRRETFKEIVDPIYSELTPVVEEYFAILCSTRDALEHADATALPTITSQLRSRRQQVFAVRQSVTALVREVEKSASDRHLLAFCKKAEAVFYSSYHSYDHGRMSPTHRGAELMDLLDHGGAARGEVIMQLNITIKKLEHIWVAVAQSHASLRIRSIAKSAL